ncbi:cytochrome c oxidase assembly protein [Gordonia terrae]
MPTPAEPRHTLPTGEKTGPNLTRLGLLALVEIVAAFVLAQGLIAVGKALRDDSPVDAATSPHSDHDMSGHGHHGHHGASMDMSIQAAGDTASPSAGTWALLTMTCVVAASLWLTRKRLAAARSQTTADAALFAGAVLSVVVMLLPPIRAAAEVSHLAMMTQLMVLILIAPALASGLMRRSIPVSDSVSRLLSIPLAIGYVVVMYLWHLPTITVTGTTAIVLGAAALVVGLGLWTTILADERPHMQKLRRVTVYVAGIPAGLLGLALIISTEPIMAGHVHGAGGLGPIADQRAGGAVMMLIEAIFLIPILLQNNQNQASVDLRPASNHKR